MSIKSAFVLILLMALASWLLISMVVVGGMARALRVERGHRIHQTMMKGY
jgi:hypothetical protein